MRSSRPWSGLQTQLPETSASEIWHTRPTATSTKVHDLTLDRTTRAPGATTGPGSTGSKLIAEKQAVLIDFRHVELEEHRTFGMLWIFHELLQFIRHRPSGSAEFSPLGLCIDEFPSFLATDHRQHRTSLRATSKNCLAARQAAGLLDNGQPPAAQPIESAMQKALMGMGRHIFAGTNDARKPRFGRASTTSYDPLLGGKQE